MIGACQCFLLLAMGVARAYYHEHNPRQLPSKSLPTMNYMLFRTNQNKIRRSRHDDSSLIRSTKSTTQAFLSPMLTSTRRILSSPLFSSPEPPRSGPTSTSTTTTASTPISKRIWFSRLVLGILVFVAGYRWGSLGTMPTTNPAPPRSSTTTVAILTSLLVGFILRDGWRMIPAWAKPSLVQRAWLDTRRLLGMVSESEMEAASAAATSTSPSFQNKEQDSNLANVATLARKLQGVWNVAERRLSSSSSSNTDNINIQSAFITLLRLLKHYKETYAQTRDEAYASCGIAPVTQQDLQGFGLGFDQWMDLADAAYNEFPNDPTMTLQRYLDQCGFDLIKHDTTVLPGYLGHYVALQRQQRQQQEQQQKKIALIGIKGTSSLEDLITDMCGAAVEMELEQGSFIPNGPTTIRAHEGILLSTQRLAKDLQPLVEQLLVPQGYQIVLVGHSLGAAAAALLGVLLRSWIPELQQPCDQHPPKMDSESSAPIHHPPPKLQVYAIASPPSLDLQSALACQSFVTTIVNNCDVIPRCNAGPVLVTVELLKIIHDQMTKQQQEPYPPSRIKNGLLFRARHRLSTLLWPWNNLLLFKTRKGWFQQQPSPPTDKNDDSDLVAEELMTCQELEDAIDQALETVGFNQDDPDQLYVAGKVLLMYDLWQEESKYMKQQRQRQQQHSPTAAQDGSMKPEENQPYNYSADHIVWAEPTAKVLRYLEFDGRMIQDHMAPSYKSSLKAICASTNA